MLKTIFRRAVVRAGLYRTALTLNRRVFTPADQREFEADQAFFRELLPPRALCFDVGANVGAKCEALASIGMRVIAFEPQPETFAELRARCDHFPDVRAIPTAIGRAADIATLHAPAWHGAASIDGTWEGDTLRTYEVPVVPLDAAIRHFGVPAFCKVDVEGWELEVLAGLTTPIPLISFEYHSTPSDLEKTRACLIRLLSLGAVSVNVTAAESPHFLHEEWSDMGTFLSNFPGSLSPGALPDYGDIFVRSEMTS